MKPQNIMKNYTTYLDPDNSNSIYLVSNGSFYRFTKDEGHLSYSVGSMEREDDTGFGNKVGIKPELNFDDLLSLFQQENTDLHNDIIEWSKNNVITHPDEVFEMIDHIKENFVINQ